MSIPFTFVEETHTYHVPGHYVLATSDVLDLAGLVNHGSVPAGILETARWRGTSLDECVVFFEEGKLDWESIPPEVMPYFKAYLRFRQEKDFEPMLVQRGIVYEHEGTGQMIGTTLDLAGPVCGDLFIVDTKCTYPYSGSAKKQQDLKWRMQLQSQWEAMMQNDEFWADALPVHNKGIRKAILHLKKDATYDFLEFSGQDEALNWDACVRMAMLRLSNGWKRSGK